MPPKKYISPTKRKEKERERQAKYRKLKETPEKKLKRLDDKSKRGRTKREAETAEEREFRLDDQRTRTRSNIEAETAEEREFRLDDQRTRTRSNIEAETAEEREFRLDDKRKRTRSNIEAETAEEREFRLDDKRKRTRSNIEKESPEETKSRLQKKKEKQRESCRQLPRSHFIARRVMDILSGIQTVMVNYFGPLINRVTKKPAEYSTQVCVFCNAVRWTGEADGLCCKNGRVELDPLFDNKNPELGTFKELFTGIHPLSSAFLRRVRPFNNALSLASMRVQRVAPPGGGWTPSVVIKGKVGILMGPLRPVNPKETPPAFCQLYVLPPNADDRDEEVKLRMGKLFLSERVSEKEKDTLEKVMGTLQCALHDVNPYVRDFKQVFQIVKEDESMQMNVIIDAEKRPSGEHGRRYNIGFKEISVVTEDANPGTDCIVVKTRDIGNHIQSIDDMHRSADPLRFTLLFPNGADGWHAHIELLPVRTPVPKSNDGNEKEKSEKKTNYTRSAAPEQIPRDRQHQNKFHEIGSTKTNSTRSAAPKQITRDRQHQKKFHEIGSTKTNSTRSAAPKQIPRDRQHQNKFHEIGSTETNSTRSAAPKQIPRDQQEIQEEKSGKRMVVKGRKKKVEGEIDKSEVDEEMDPIEKTKRVQYCTGRMFYSFHMQMRDPIDDHYNPIHWGRQLSQEYFCRAYARIEGYELKWHARNQKKLRAEKYQKLFQETHPEEKESERLLDSGEETADIKQKLGKMVILPPSHIGGPRHMRAQFQDAMAIVRHFGKPHLFITFTCNPKWPEIEESIFPQQQSQDRPDIVARVFHKKLKNFQNDILKENVMGKVAAHVNVVEFQKRGLPHNHMLLIMESDSAIDTPEKVDQVICAELPPDPETLPKGPQREQAQRLLDLVLKNMIHTHNPSCRDEHGNCSKKYPQPFREETIWNESAYYPEYRRRRDRVVEYKGKIIQNYMVVPYNPYLLLKYEAHINVECCVSVGSVKYVYKYVYKGPDRLMLAAGYDEIKNYQNLRSIGSSEACWRIFEFPITGRNPAVYALRIHLENEQMVFFEEDDAKAVAEEGPKETELSAFFKYNEKHPETKVKYVDMPNRHTWNINGSKKWAPRKVNKESIGRIHGVHPGSGEVFYLRLLLHHDQCKGKKSFEDVRTIDGHVYESYKDTCQALGLLQDDGEWHWALTEAAETKMPYQLRRLYVVLLLFCEPAYPRDLFDRHYTDWTDDYERRFPEASSKMLKALVLLDLEQKLQERGKDLSDFKLPILTTEEREELSHLLGQEVSTKDSVAMQEEMNFNVEEVMAEKQEMEQNLNNEQRRFYEEIVEHMRLGKGGIFFLNARGGTGKTYLLTAILHAARSFGNEKGVAIGVASSGIAAILLPQGKTFHSRFKVPVQFVDENTTLNIKPNDSVAKVIESSRVIIWDEAPMMNRFLLEALNKTLKDISKDEAFFGGKIIILSGDFRQILPVVEHGSRAQICAASVRKSKLWKYFQIRHLTQNMRVGSDKSLQEFDHYLEDMGNGVLPIVMEPDWIELPENMVSEIIDTSNQTIKKSMEDFTQLIFPCYIENYQRMDEKEWIRWTSERAILAPKNIEVDMINETIVEKFPGVERELFSADLTLDPMDGLDYPVEFLNLLTPSGIPPYRLVLKEGIIVMLMRNLNARDGLCNGTRLIVTKISKLILQCKIACGSRAEETVFIPRIGLIINEEGTGGLPFAWKRTQFPIRPAFGMTINKSQGQTLKKVGVWLREPCFSHGQLYVASSRVGNPANLHYAVTTSECGLTRNVVFHEALLDSSNKSTSRQPFSGTRAPSSGPPDSDSDPEYVGEEQLEPENNFNPPDVEWQKQICEKTGLKFMKKSRWEHWSVGQKFKHNSKPTGYRKMAADGNCFFRAISYVITGTQEQYPAIRAMLCDWIEEHGAPILFLDTLEERQEYLEHWQMRANKAWAHENEISAAADMFQIPISVSSEYGDGRAWQIYRPRQPTDCAFGLFMDNVNDDHYDLVTTIAY